MMKKGRSTKAAASATTEKLMKKEFVSENFPEAVKNEANQTKVRKKKLKTHAARRQDLEVPKNGQLIMSAEPETDTPHMDTDLASKYDGDDASVFREELADLPMEEVLKVKETLGSKLYNKLFYEAGPSSSGASHVATAEKKQAQPPAKNSNSAATEFKRKNRKRPREMSAKRPVAECRDIFPSMKKERWDPRFATGTADYSEFHFKQNYAFLNELQAEETEALKKELKTTEDEEKITEIFETIRKMRNKRKTEEEKERGKEKIRKLRKQNTERMKQGKNPIFLKKSELKRQQLEEKYADLKQKGKLEKYLERKEKKRAKKRLSQMLQFDDE